MSSRVVGFVAASMLAFHSGRGASSELSSAEAAGRLASAARASEIRSRGGAPFHLSADVTYVRPDGRKVEGTLDVDWEGTSRWIDRLVAADHSEMSGHDGRGAWLISDLPYRPLRMFDLEGALSFATRLALADGSTIEKARAERKNGASTVKVRVAVPGRMPWREFSLDAASGLLIREESAPKPERSVRYVARYEYGDYRPWDGRSVPWLIRRSDRNQTVLEVRVTAIEPLRSGAALDRPAGAVVLADCTAAGAALVAARCDGGGGPHWHAHARGTGVISARAVIGRDGRVRDTEIVDGGQPDLQGDARSFLEGLRCVPAECGGVPTDTEMIEAFRFDLFGR